jgi:serine phosphatase RsbU (regulator of sigma subunit)
MIEAMPLLYMSLHLKSIKDIMNRLFTITLIENSISEAARITFVTGEHLGNYRLSIVRNVSEALAHPDLSQAVVLNYSQMITDWPDTLLTLTQAYPQTPLILLMPALYNEAELAQLLHLGVTDYMVLSEMGLLLLARRLVVLDRLWQLEQAAQSYQAEQHRYKESEILRDVARVVGSSLNLKEVLGRVLEQLSRLISYDTASIQLIQGERRKIVAAHGFTDLNHILGITFKLDDHDPGSIAIHTHKPFIVNDILSKFPSFRHPLGHQIKSWLGLPLMVNEQVTGLITLDNLKADAYQESHAELGLAFAQQVATALENARLHEIYINRIEHELEIAQEIQETLLPQVVPEVPGLQISGRILPARQVGGDFFHFFSVGGGNQLGVAVGDVSGKGIPAALYMAVAITAIDIQVRTDLTPGELMNRLNEALYNRLHENKMNIGLQVAIFEPLLAPEGEVDEADTEARGVLMTVASGGMIAPIGATERGCRFLPVSGLPIGALPSPDHLYEDDMFLLDPFTTIIFTSDGIVEAQNEQGELFGFDRLEATINEIASVRDAETMADYIIAAAQKFMGKAEQHDDMTVVVVVKT